MRCNARYFSTLLYCVFGIDSSRVLHIPAFAEVLADSEQSVQMMSDRWLLHMLYEVDAASGLAGMV